MPIMEPVEVRTYGDSTTIYPMPFLTNENMLYYQSAYRMDMRKVIDLVATVQNMLTKVYLQHYLSQMIKQLEI